MREELHSEIIFVFDSMGRFIGIRFIEGKLNPRVMDKNKNLQTKIF